MNLDNLNDLTPDQVNEIKVNGGFSGSLTGGIQFGNSPEVFAPKSSVKINGYGTNLRPRMSTHGDTVIKGPSAELPKKLARQAEEQLKERQQASRNQQADLSNQALRKDLEVMRRQVKRLEKLLKEKDA